MNVYPIQSQPEGDGAKCPNCGAPVAADQRYCLACGQPCAPVRLAFLDVLQAENELRVAPIAISPPTTGYLPSVPQDDGAISWLRRYSGLFGLLAVLLIAGLIGLLVGHWLAPSKAPSASVVKIEGNFPASAAAVPTTTTPSGSSSSSGTATTSKTAAAAEAKEVKEVKEAETAKAKPKPASKPGAATLQKLKSSNGKQHQNEIAKLTEGDKPIETGG